MANEPEEPPYNEEEEGGPVKPFLEHLEDLRWVMIKCISALLIAMAGCMAGVPYVTDFLRRPLPPSVKLEILGPLDGFWISMKISFFAGMVLALPIILYVIMNFVLPALKRKEKKYVLRAIIVGAGLFLAGVALCYYLMLPISLRAVIQYNAWMKIPTTIWRAQEYFSFVSWFMIGMGLSFELPVVVLTLVKLGIIEHRVLVKSQKYVLVINLIVCAFITPDPVTTVFMIIPMQLLFLICIMISSYWERQKKRAEETALLSAPEHAAD